jgi:hypothetical protein
LKGIPELAGADFITLKPIVQEWHAAALAKLGPDERDFDEAWGEFAHCWGRVRHAAGVDVLADALAVADQASDPPEAMQHSANTRRLLRLCVELQRRAGDAPFFLSCPTAARTLGIDKVTAWRQLIALVADKILTVEQKHTATKATRYRFGSEHTQ